jgi:hypothetical protein
MNFVERLSHMPFPCADGSVLICISEGLECYTPETLGSSKSAPKPAAVNYQPWKIALVRQGEVMPIEVRGMAPNGPTRVFCNPVMDRHNMVSFVYGGTLFRGELSGNTIDHVFKVQKSITTGFAFESKAAFCDGVSPVVKLSDNYSPYVKYDTPFDYVLRVVPHGQEHLIITGKKDDRFFSLLLFTQNGDYRVIKTASGIDVYKCCIVGDQVIHAAKCGSTMEDRILRIDPIHEDFHGL